MIADAQNSAHIVTYNICTRRDKAEVSGFHGSLLRAHAPAATITGIIWLYGDILMMISFIFPELTQTRFAWPLPAHAARAKMLTWHEDEGLHIWQNMPDTIGLDARHLRCTAMRFRFSLCDGRVRMLMMGAYLPTRLLNAPMKMLQHVLADAALIFSMTFLLFHL